MRRSILAAAALACACGGEPADSTGAADDADTLMPLEPFVTLEPPLAEAPADAAPLRRAYAHLAVDIDGVIARTTVTEVLVNDLDSPAEASFRFPLPADATVTDFAHWQDGRRVRAELEDEDDARAEFERAAAAGERAALADEDGRFFEMKLAAIPPGGQRRVELSYAQTLASLGGETRYALPVRRYEAAPPTVLDLELSVTAAGAITDLASPSHPDARVTRRSQRRWTLHLSRPRVGLERDFVAAWQERVADLDLAGRAVRRAAGEPAYVEARFGFHRDPRPDEREPIAAVVVVDRSLSMAGEPLARAQELAAAVLDGLTPRDSVALVTFADDLRTTELAPATAEHRAALERELADLIARGYSNLPAALDEAAALLAGRKGGLIVLATDGQPTVGADLEVLPAARAADVAGARAVIAHFNYPSRTAALEALFPGAETHFVPGGAAGGDTVAELARLAVAPSIDELAVEIVGASENTVHGRVPARLAMGESVRLVARADADVSVRVTGRLRGQPVTLERRIEVPAAPGDGGDRGLPVEWARLRLRDLDRRYAAGETELEAEIRALGGAHRLATRFSSFVVTDSLSPDRIKPGDPEIRVRAPRSAGAVYAVLPWGELVHCSWSDAAGAWVGRFLVPRSAADGLYRVRVFVQTQAGTELRGTLFYRVDSAPPRFSLAAHHDGRVLLLRAEATEGVFDASSTGDLITELVDLRRLVVRVGDRDVELTREDDGGAVWTASVPVALPPGRHELVLTATDYAANSSQARATVEVPR